MQFTLYVEIHPQWVLEHREDEVLPVKALINGIKKLYPCNVTEETFTGAEIAIEADVDFAVVKEKALDIFKELYGDKAMDQIEINGERVGDRELVGSDKAKETDKDKPSDGDRSQKGSAAQRDDETDELLERLEALLGRSDDSSDTPSEQNKGKTDDDAAKKILEEIGSLAGAQEFYALAEETAKVLPALVKKDLESVFMSRCYLFAISDGCGHSTAMSMFGKLVNSLGINCGTQAREIKLPPYSDKPEVLDGVISKIESAGSSRRVTMLSLDISEWMNKTDNIYFKNMLRAVESNHEGLIVFFRIPFVEKELSARIGSSLNDVLTTRIVTFPPASREQVLSFSKNELKNKGFTVRQAALDKIWTRITEEKSDGRFYGMKTVKKVLDELVYIKLDRTPDSNVITEKDAALLCKDENASSKTGQEMLDALVGNEGLKQQVGEMIAQIKLARLTSEDVPCIHMRFVGNPGTGKTTVARIVGKILKENGILRIGNFIECSGRDFCGRYIGETAPKTAGICRDAYGSVLFIDEAYSLYRGDDDSRDFGREALDTLIAEMENHRADLVVIMAGYTDDMEKLMQGNRGLKSRMPYTIEFPNFSREQLNAIFLSLLDSKFKYEEGIKEAAKEYFDKIPDDVLESKEFSNGRFVRNLYERLWAKAAMRCQLAGQKDVVLTCKDFELATAEKDFALGEGKVSKLGFY